ncbi:MAG: prolyl oligopeptidase family serine peptidase [Candidatus Eisenbacteria bacterium]
MSLARSFIGTFALASLAATCAFAANADYQVPPTVVTDLLTAPRLPRTAPNLSPEGARIAQPDLRSLIPIGTLAEPVEKLAGYEILTEYFATRAALKNAAAGLTFYSLSHGAALRAQLPKDARLGSVVWSNRGDRVACALYAPGGAELWIVDAATGASRRVPGVRLHGVPRVMLEWSEQDDAILTRLVPAGASLPALGSRVPQGPAVRQSSGRAAPQRTAREVLRTPEDQARFVFFSTTQLARVSVDRGVATPIGAPVALGEFVISPDEKWWLVTRFVTPPPVGFPASLLPTVTELWPSDGGTAIRVGESPLNDRSAIASVAPLGPRDVAFSPADGALWFCSWEDTPGASALAAVRDTALAPPGSDGLYRWDAPFTGTPRRVHRAEFPIEGFALTADGGRVLVQEGYEPRRLERQSALDPKSGRATVLTLRSSEGVYSAPGQPLTRDLRHATVLWTTADGAAFYRAGDGFGPQGQRPFLDRCSFEGRATVRLFQSDAQHLENVTSLLTPDASRFVTLRQSATEPPNYFLHRLGESRAKPITAFGNPMQALSQARRIPFTFKREDGVTLNAEAVLPADWGPAKPLPTVFWIYPNDYRSAAAASENRSSPNRFPSQSALNPEVLVTQGYAVIKPELAIVGTNDQYVTELRKSATAAVEECVRRGFTDRERVAVGGHSYGAFSTVNCLAHTRLFRAGLASDGAYNRTLTPFTFQAETRNLWDARDTYLQMSPFLYADRIEAPLLLVHNQDDTNVGTNPIQSDRLYEALNGLGRTVQLVQYPYEDHGPVARETVLDYWSRAIEWFDRYVKNAPARSAGSTSATP